MRGIYWKFIKYGFLSLFFIHGLGLFLFGQSCYPEGPITLDHSALNSVNLQNIFEQYKAAYEDKDVQDLRTRLANCQRSQDQQLREIEGRISSLSLKYQEVLSYKDVEGIQKTIRDLGESRKKSQEELQQNLMKVKHTGIFVVLLRDIDIYESKDILVKQALSSLTKRAVEDLNGTYIKRYSSVENYDKVRDVIQSLTSGEVTAEREYYNNPNFAKKHFLYVGKIAVTPLRSTLGKSIFSEGQNTLVLNMGLDKDFLNLLRAEGVREEDLDKITSEVIPNMGVIDSENRDASARQERNLLMGNEEIRRIDREIEEAQRKLDTRKEKIESICKELKVSFQKNNIENSANEALLTIKKEIEKLNRDWNVIKEKEIIPKETRHAIEGKASESFASETLKLVEQLRKQHNTVQKMAERLEVVDLKDVNSQTTREIQLFRDIDRVWAYPVPQEDGSFKLYVFARFRITEPDNAFFDRQRKEEEDRRRKQEGIVKQDQEEKKKIAAKVEEEKRQWAALQEKQRQAEFAAAYYQKRVKLGYGIAGVSLLGGAILTINGINEGGFGWDDSAFQIKMGIPLMSLSMGVLVRSIMNTVPAKRAKKQAGNYQSQLNKRLLSLEVGPSTHSLGIGLVYSF